MNAPKQDLSRYSFGITSAIVTSLALMLGLDSTVNAKTSIIGALLIIAIADNISDSLGIHVYRESQGPETAGDTRVYTISNFLTRLAVMTMFIALVVTLPLGIATYLSIAVGLTLLTVLNYYIAVAQNENVPKALAQHLGTAIVVVILAHFLGQLIAGFFKL